MKHFYTGTDKHGEPMNDLEEILAFVEGHAAPAIKKLEDRCWLTPTESSALCYFISYMLTRVPRFRDKVGDLAIQFNSPNPS